MRTCCIAPWLLSWKSCWSITNWNLILPCSFIAHFNYYFGLTLCSESLRLAFKGNLTSSTRERSHSGWEIWTYKNSYLLKHSHHQQTMSKNIKGYYSTCKELKHFHHVEQRKATQRRTQVLQRDCNHLALSDKDNLHQFTN